MDPRIGLPSPVEPGGRAPPMTLSRTEPRSVGGGGGAGRAGLSGQRRKDGFDARAHQANQTEEVTRQTRNTQGDCSQPGSKGEDSKL